MIEIKMKLNLGRIWVSVLSSRKHLLARSKVRRSLTVKPSIPQPLIVSGRACHKKLSWKSLWDKFKSNSHTRHNNHNLMHYLGFPNGRILRRVNWINQMTLTLKWTMNQRLKDQENLVKAEKSKTLIRSLISKHQHFYLPSKSPSVF